MNTQQLTHLFMVERFKRLIEFLDALQGPTPVLQKTRLQECLLEVASGQPFKFTHLLYYATVAEKHPTYIDAIKDQVQPHTHFGEQS